jgi:phosphatidylglycerol:prolipoprotein diacylglycerol transferase
MYDTLTIPALGIALPTQQLVFWTAVLLGTTLGPLWIAWTEHLDLPRLRATQALLAFFGLAGGRLHFVLNNPHFYDAHPLRAVLPWGGGMHMSGAVIGLCIGAPLAARRYRLPIAKLADGLIVVTAFAYAGTRLGCLLGGCCFGTYCDRAWAVTYPPGSIPFVIQQQAGLLAPNATASLPVHPAQIYFLLAAVVSGSVAVAVGRRKQYDGQVFWIGLTLLAATTVLVEPFRALENHRVFWVGVPQLVWTELALTIVGLAGLTIAGLRHRRASQPTAPAPWLGATEP